MTGNGYEFIVLDSQPYDMGDCVRWRNVSCLGVWSAIGRLLSFV
jgi:hypothetical protein